MGVVLDHKSKIGQYVSERNRGRQYDFLNTTFEMAKVTPDFKIDRQFLCDLNFYAAQYLSEQPGRYRVNYEVTVGNRYNPPRSKDVEDEMALFFNNLNRLWDRMSPIESAAFALWGVNHVHPFAEGNGRSSRAICYYIMCTKIGDWLPGSKTVMEAIRLDHRPQYCDILSRMDVAKQHDGTTDLTEMAALLDTLLLNQITS